VTTLLSAAVKDAPVSRDIGVALDQPLLHCDGAAHRLDRTGKFDQEAVASGLDDAAAMLGNAGIDQIAPARLEPGERSFLVRPHKAGVASDIGSDDRSELAFGMRRGGGA
jgi:hypothetical protein